MEKINYKYAEAAEEYNKCLGKRSITDVAKEYQVDRHTLARHLKDNEYKKYEYPYKDDLYYFDNTEWEAINEYLENPQMTFIDISNKYGYKNDTFKRKLEVLGYDTQFRYKLQYNRNAFKEIKTEEDAYWLGFILADGYINETRYRLNIKLGIKDTHHLEKFCDYMQADYSMIKDDVGGVGNPIKSLTFASKQIVENLKQYGLFQNKSTKEKPYLGLEPSLIPHYIRGLIDGDGCLTHGEGQYQLDFVGSYDVVSYIRNYINDNVIALSHSYIYDHDKIYRLTLRWGPDIYACYKCFYENAKIYLDRKYKIAIQYLNGRE